MKILLVVLALLAVALSFSFSDAQCPHDLEVLCADDINKAFPIC